MFSRRKIVNISLILFNLMFMIPIEIFQNCKIKCRANKIIKKRKS